MSDEASSTARVRTEYGTVIGSRVNGIARFLGIPYSAPLHEVERFLPPRRAQGWDGSRFALAVGPSAPQPGSIRARLVLGDSPPSGDACLVVNIWTPAPSTSAALPVLCWVHGGGFTNGSGGVPALDGAQLATSGVVVVTINYRLGALGFAHHPDLPGDTANRGLDDVVAALGWLRCNVASFGGDPGMITLAGDSAGAMCAGLVAVSPEPDLPIAQLALHSGMPAVEPAQASIEKVERLASTLGVHVKELAMIPSAHLVRATARLGPAGRFMPVAEAGLALPLDELLQAAPARPALVTTTTDEGTFFLVDERSPRALTVDEAISELDATCGHGTVRYDAALTATEQGQSIQPHRVFARAYAHARFGEPADNWSRRMSARAPVWRARYHRGATLWDGWLGATHTLDVPLTFGTHKAPALARLYSGDPDVDDVSAALQSHFVRFLHGEQPRPDWPTWLPERQHVEVLGTNPSGDREE